MSKKPTRINNIINEFVQGVNEILESQLMTRFMYPNPKLIF